MSERLQCKMPATKKKKPQLEPRLHHAAALLWTYSGEDIILLLYSRAKRFFERYCQTKKNGFPILELGSWFDIVFQDYTKCEGRICVHSATKIDDLVPTRVVSGQVQFRLTIEWIRTDPFYDEFHYKSSFGNFVLVAKEGGGPQRLDIWCHLNQTCWHRNPIFNEVCGHSQPPLNNSNDDIPSTSTANLDDLPCCSSSLNSTRDEAVCFDLVRIGSEDDPSPTKERENEGKSKKFLRYPDDYEFASLPPSKAVKEGEIEEDQLGNRQFIFESPEPIAIVEEEEETKSNQPSNSRSHQLWAEESPPSEEENSDDKLCNQQMQMPTGSRSIWHEPSDEEEEEVQQSQCQKDEDEDSSDNHLGLSSKSDKFEDEDDNRIGLTSEEEEDPEDAPFPKDHDYEYAPTASPNLSRQSSVASLSPWQPQPDDKFQFPSELAERNKNFDWTNFVAGVVVDHIRNRTTEKIVCCKVYPFCRDEPRVSELFLETDKQLSLGQWIKFDRNCLFNLDIGPGKYSCIEPMFHTAPCHQRVFMECQIVVQDRPKKEIITKWYRPSQLESEFKSYYSRIPFIRHIEDQSRLIKQEHLSQNWWAAIEYSRKPDRWGETKGYWRIVHIRPKSYGELCDKPNETPTMN